MLDKEKLLQSIAKEEALLSRLDTVREQALSRINDFKRELALLEASCSESHAPYAARTSQEKVTLFRSLFRGRVDIFPKLWTSWVFRSNSGTHSGAIQAPVPIEFRHPFRSNSGTL